MIRTLFIIAGAALVLSVAALAGAFAIGGRDLAREGWAWTLTDDSGESVRFERVTRETLDDLGPVVTRELAWTGGEALAVESHLDVDYVQGSAASVTVSGPQALAERVVLDDGRLSLAPGDERVVFAWGRGGVQARSERDALKVTVTAPSVRRFTVSGSGDLDIRDYDQPTLDVTISGSGDVTAAGRAPRVAVTVSGSGEADLGAVEATDAEVTISGSGETRLSAEGVVDARISGSGELDLARRPRQLNSQVSGSGRVRGD